MGLLGAPYKRFSPWNMSQDILVKFLNLKKYMKWLKSYYIKIKLEINRNTTKVPRHLEINAFPNNPESKRKSQKK